MHLMGRWVPRYGYDYCNISGRDVQDILDGAMIAGFPVANPTSALDELRLLPLVSVRIHSLALGMNAAMTAWLIGAEPAALFSAGANK